VSWYPSPAITRLFAQANQTAPNRARLSDGIIGDPAHSSRVSDHNPRPDGEVTAGDLTHDPARFDAHRMARQLAASGDPRLKYIISNDQIWSRARASEGWRPYQPDNPRRNKHIKHAHISVQPDSSGAPWALPMFGPNHTNSEELDMDENRLRQIVADEVNRAIAFLVKVIDTEGEERDQAMAEWTKAMSDLTVRRVKDEA